MRSVSVTPSRQWHGSSLESKSSDGGVHACGSGCGPRPALCSSWTATPTCTCSTSSGTTTATRKERWGGGRLACPCPRAARCQEHAHWRQCTSAVFCAAHLPGVWQEDTTEDSYFTRACKHLHTLCREKVRQRSGPLASLRMLSLMASCMVPCASWAGRCASLH